MRKYFAVLQKNVKRASIYRGKFFPTIGSAEPISVRHQLPLPFVMYTSSLQINFLGGNLVVI